LEAKFHNGGTGGGGGGRGRGREEEEEEDKKKRLRDIGNICCVYVQAYA
jgi:hypothetical protein